MPKECVSKMKSAIAEIDKCVSWATKKQLDMPYFFVIHFPKKKFDIRDYERVKFLLLPRNYRTREMAYRRACVLGEYLKKVENSCHRKSGSRQRVYCIDADDYYRKKRYSICLPKQDILDNLVWILYRSLELGVIIEASQREILRSRAQELLYEIYNKHMFEKEIYPNESLDCYYYSWKLRGDHPSLYRSGEYRNQKTTYNFLYEECKKTPGNLGLYRKMKNVAEYVFLYHFDSSVRSAGCVPGFVDLYEWFWYSGIVSALQQAMRLEVAKKGIAIECNPTSNVLIGTFGSYDKHPLLTFNRYHLEDGRTEPNIVASINTDDLGVFDTSLENEYALMLCAILQERHYKHNYNDDAVYDYLDHIRENGLQMVLK